MIIQLQNDDDNSSVQDDYVHSQSIFDIHNVASILTQVEIFNLNGQCVLLSENFIRSDEVNDVLQVLTRDLISGLYIVVEVYFKEYKGSSFKSRRLWFKP